MHRPHTITVVVAAAAVVLLHSDSEEEEEEEEDGFSLFPSHSLSVRPIPPVRPSSLPSSLQPNRVNIEIRDKRARNSSSGVRGARERSERRSRRIYGRRIVG